MSSEEQSFDRRQFSRVDFHHELTLHGSSGRVYHGAFNDISLHGMLFWCEELPPVGEELTGSLPLGDDRMVLAGVVVRVHKFGSAIRFHDLDVESFSHLRRLVSLNMGDADRIDREFFATL